MSLRSSRFSALLPVFLILIAVVWTYAESPEPVRGRVVAAPPADQQITPGLEHLSAEQAAKLRPELHEIHEILVAARGQVDAIAKRLETASDPVSALEIQREISDAKERAEIEILEVQAKYARLEGRTNQVEKIENAIRSLTSRLEASPARRGAVR